MKNKLAYMMIAVFLAANIFGCSNTNQTVGTQSGGQQETEALKVVTTLFYQYDFTKQIVGDNMEIELLLRPSQESHSYEPTPADIIAIHEADIFIYNGGASELWIEKVLEDVEGVHAVRMMDYVDIVEEETVEGMEDNHGHGSDDHGYDDDEHKHDDDEHGHDDDDHRHDDDEHGHDNDDHRHDDDDHEHDDDEHIWTSPVNAMTLVQALIDEFSEIDSENKETYETNGVSYIAQLKELDQEFREVMEQAVRTTLVFGDRFPLRYFVDEYELDYFAAFPGCSTETEPGMGTITFLTDKIKKEGIPVVYHLELSNEKIADTLCEGTGASKRMFHTAHNVTKEEFARGVTYVDIMRGNVESLKAGVK